VIQHVFEACNISATSLSFITPDARFLCVGIRDKKRYKDAGHLDLLDLRRLETAAPWPSAIHLPTFAAPFILQNRDNDA